MDPLNQFLQELRSKMPNESPEAFKVIEKFLTNFQNLTIEPAHMREHVLDVVTDGLLGAVTMRRDMHPEILQQAYNEPIFLQIREAITVGGNEEQEIFATNVLMYIAHLSSARDAGSFIPFVCSLLGELKMEDES